MIRAIKKCLTFAVAVTVSSCTATGQQPVNDFLTLDTVLNLKQRLFDIADICTCKDGNDVYFINYNTRLHCDSLYLYQLNTETIRLDSYLIALPDMTQLLKNHNCHRWSSIACNGKNLLLTTNTLHYIFENMNGKYYYKSHWDLETNGDNCTFLNDSVVVISDMYYGHKPQSSITMHNIYSGKIIREIFPYYFHTLLSFFGPKHPVDINNGIIILAHNGIYSMVILNSNLDSIGCIARNVANWTQLSEKQISKISKHYDIHDAGNIINAMDKYMFQIHRLFEVYWIDTNKVLTAYQTPGHKGGFPKAFVDVWEKLDGKYTLIHNDIEDNYEIRTEKDSIIGPHSYGLATQSGHQLLFTADNKVVVFRNYETSINPLGLSTKEYWDKYNEKIIEQGMTVNIFIFSHKF